MKTTKEITCNEMPCPNPGDRSFHTSSLFKNYMITYGGYSNSSKKALADIKVLNLKRNSFEEFRLEGDEPCLRERHSACLIDPNKILVFGGCCNGEILHETAMITVKETMRKILQSFYNMINSFSSYPNVSKDQNNRGKWY